MEKEDGKQIHEIIDDCLDAIDEIMDTLKIMDSSLRDALDMLEEGNKQ